MKRSIVPKISWVVPPLLLAMSAWSCGSESGADLYRPNPRVDAGNTGAAGGQSGAGGTSGGGGGAGAGGVGTGGAGANPSGGTGGATDASAGISGAGGSGGTTGSGGSGATDASAGSGGSIGMGGADGTAGAMGIGGAAATGGTDGTGGAGATGGTDGTGGAAGSGGASGSAGSGGGSDAGPKTCASNGDCESDEFCAKIGCALPFGECQPRPKLCEVSHAPVCGCDGVNYWNDCLRRMFGVASSASGECLAPAACGGLAGLECPTSRAFCAQLFSTELECAVSDAFGACWVVPEQCPQVVVGANHRPCAGTDRCESKCEAIKAQHGHFVDTTCPQ